MANLFYKDHLITVVGRTDEISQFWIPVADISWETDGQRKSHTITGGLDWISNWQDVERHMVELAKAWVDGLATRHNLIDRRALNRGAGEPKARTGEVKMARLLYKGNLITVDCARKNRGLWNPTVGIRWIAHRTLNSSQTNYSKATIRPKPSGSRWVRHGPTSTC
jgi:hypothetical protein